MNDDLEDLSEETYNFKWFEAEFDDLTFDDWLSALGNLYRGF